MPKTRARKRFESWCRGQFISMESVEPKQKYDPLHKAMFFDSPAGHIEVRFKTRKLVPPFRDKYANRFEQTKDFKGFVKLYNEMRAERIKGVRVIYTANAHTRLKGKLCSLII